MYFFNVSKMSKSGCKLVMFCRKVKDAEGKGSRAQFVRHPLGDFRPPPEVYSATPWKKS